MQSLGVGVDRYRKIHQNRCYSSRFHQNRLRFFPKPRYDHFWWILREINSIVKFQFLDFSRKRDFSLDFNKIFRLTWKIEKLSWSNTRFRGQQTLLTWLGVRMPILSRNRRLTSLYLLAPWPICCAGIAHSKTGIDREISGSEISPKTFFISVLWVSENIVEKEWMCYVPTWPTSRAGIVKNLLDYTSLVF